MMRIFIALLFLLTLGGVGLEAQQRTTQPRVYSLRYDFATNGNFGGAVADTLEHAATLPVGSLILKAWAVVSDSLISAGAAADSVSVAFKADTTTIKVAQLASQWLPAEAVYAADSSLVLAGTTGKPKRMLTAGKLNAVFLSAGATVDSLTKGTVDFYALVAVP